MSIENYCQVIITSVTSDLLTDQITEVLDDKQTDGIHTRLSGAMDEGTATSE